MCTLFYSSFMWLHVYAFAFKSMVYCRSVFEPGASKLPYYCTPHVTAPDITGARAARLCVDKTHTKKKRPRVPGRPLQWWNKETNKQGGGLSVTVVCLTVPQFNATLCVAINKIEPSYMACVRSLASVGLIQHYSPFPRNFEMRLEMVIEMQNRRNRNRSHETLILGLRVCLSEKLPPDSEFEKPETYLEQQFLDSDSDHDFGLYSDDHFESHLLGNGLHPTQFWPIPFHLTGIFRKGRVFLIIFAGVCVWKNCVRIFFNRLLHRPGPL